MVQRWPLSLRFRFLALLGSVLLCAMLALGALSHWLIFPALQAEERDAAHRELDRTARGLVLSQQQLHAQAQGRHRAVRFASPLASDASSTHNTPP